MMTTVLKNSVGDPDPFVRDTDPRIRTSKNVTDPQHCKKHTNLALIDIIPKIFAKNFGTFFYLGLKQKPDENKASFRRK
jgi:hypothetical protein